MPRGYHAQATCTRSTGEALQKGTDAIVLQRSLSIRPGLPLNRLESVKEQERPVLQDEAGQTEALVPRSPLRGIAVAEPS